MLKNNGMEEMIKVDVKYFSEQDYIEAKKFIAWLREALPVYFHEESCNIITSTQMTHEDSITK